MDRTKTAIDGKSDVKHKRTRESTEQDCQDCTHINDRPSMMVAADDTTAHSRHGNSYFACMSNRNY